MKKVFKSDEIAHVWAHQSAPAGSCSSNMCFRGPSFYSYSTEMARIITRKGRKAVIVNDTSYSNTTSKHQSHIRRALNGLEMPLFHVGDIGRGCSLSFDGKQIFEYAVRQAADYAGRAARARSHKESFLASQSLWLESAREINGFFGLRRKVDEKAIERLREATELARKQAAEAARIRNAKEQAEQLEQYEAWKAGTASAYGLNVRLFPIAFRVETGTDGEELVSIYGARVPLHDARVAYRFARSHASGWQANGETCPVGMYHLNSISPAGIVAGCHRISWDEVTRLAPVLA